YLINATGYYCVDAASTHDFTARADWTNAHGQLPAGEYPKVHVYAVLMGAYILIALVWAFMSWRVWSEVLPVQNRLFALVCLMAVDMGLNFGFWQHYNAHGAPSLAYSVALVVVDAGRNSLSFFMLLVVALGWGVVRPSLGKAMIRCTLLAGAHFGAGCLYGAGIVFRDPHDAGPLGLVYVVPLSFTMTLFYVWTLSAIIATTHMLIDRQQSYKLAMYNRLWRLLMLSLILLFVYFVLNVMYTVFYSRPELADRTWKWRWFWTDGWLNLEYFAVLATILFWWRPTTQNYRFGLEELAGDEEEAMQRDQ
ncbi:transmembrane receptor, partial [Linderina pennispora]